MQKNIVWHENNVSLKKREEHNGHKGVLIWLTGLSGSGKSTVATALEQKLFEKGSQVYILDGDNVRHGLNEDLGFSAEERSENIRRIGEVAKLFVNAGVITITSFISPFQKDRDKVRNLLPEYRFLETYVKAPLEICEQRDPKGLYKKARKGDIKDFTGIDSPYEAPKAPEIIVETFKYTVEDNVNEIYNYLIKHNYLMKKQ